MPTAPSALGGEKKVNGDFVLRPKLMNSSVIMGKSTAVPVFSLYQVRSCYVVGDNINNSEIIHIIRLAEKKLNLQLQ